MLKRLGALAAGTLLLFAFSGGPPAISAGPPTIVVGQVRDAQGMGLSQTDVMLYLASQDTAETVPVVSAVTDANGNYVLGSEDTAQLQSIAAANDGYVNFDLVVDTPTLFFLEGMSRQYVNGAWVNRSENVPSKNIRMTTSNSSVVQMPRDSWSADAPTGKLKTKCGKLPVRSDTRWTDIGEFHSANDTHGTFTYGRTADSDIGVGFQKTGQNWSISGSVHIGNSNGSDVGWNKGPNTGRRLQTKMKYMLYRWVSCANPGVTVSHEIDAQAWVSGTHNGQGNSSLDGHCGSSPYKASFSKGTHFSRTSNRAVLFNGAVGVFGASLSAQSGYSTWVESHWYFGHHAKAHWLCGSDNFLPYAHRVFAGR